jgi:hypothetical protein
MFAGMTAVPWLPVVTLPSFKTAKRGGYPALSITDRNWYPREALIVP